MDQIRTILSLALAMVLFLLWQAWQHDYGGLQQPGSAAPQDDIVAAGSRDVPQAPKAPAAAEPVPQAPGTAALVGEQPIHVRTDLFDAEIDAVGGNLRRLDLLKYSVSVDRPNIPFNLFSDQLPNLFVAQSGLLGSESAPDHHATFEAEHRAYVLEESQDRLEVKLHWQDPSGIQVNKVYTFRRGSYVIDIAYQVTNPTENAWTGRMYGQFQRTEPPSQGGIGFVYTYTGGVLSTPENPYEKIDFGEIAKEDLSTTAKGGWIAMIQHYFLGAWVPAQEALNYFYTNAVEGPRYVIGVMLPEISISAQSSGSLQMSLFAGPKIQDRLEQVAPFLNRTVDYGWLWFIAQPLFWLLKFIHDWVGNWGWAIIFLTVLIKLAFFHLSAASYKSMARMRKLQPRLTALRERYGDDRARMNQAMMDLYKKEKINPLGGCLPILVQIPVFIALYWVLLESVELRQADFMFWIDDLSTYDPYFVLPILMGITMFLQQRLNPAPPDPIQAKIMMALPFVFTFFFLFFPSGLVLYWFVNNLLSIAQQWVITRRIASEPG
nr:membrane protein insertase YidC [Gammaproteobacteria bacterium]